MSCFWTVIGICLWVFISGFVQYLPGAGSEKSVERWDYNIYYSNVPSTKLSFTIDQTDPSKFLLTVTAQTRYFYSLLFKVDNSYQMEMDTEKYLPSFLSKKVDQKNVRQAWTITYDQIGHRAKIDTMAGWELPVDCHNHFSMLFWLRNQPLQVSQIHEFNLDNEYLCWQVQATVIGEESLDLDPGQVDTRKVQLVFKRLNSGQSRPWKTDLLTNRIAKETMYIWYGVEQPRLIYRVDYDSKTKMTLQQVKKINQ